MKKSELRQIIREAISELVASRNIEELGGMIAGVKNRAEESAANRTSEGAQPPGSLGLEHSGETDMADPEEKREVAIGKQILQLCAAGEKGEETIADKGHPFRYGKSVSTYDQISALAEELIRMHGSSITENK